MIKKLAINILLIWPMMGCLVSCGNNESRVKVSHDFQLTEKNAILYTRKALEQYGLNSNEIVAVPYSSKEKIIFARNTHKPNQGYVLWNLKSNVKTKFLYRVSISVSEGHIFTAISEAK